MSSKIYAVEKRQRTRAKVGAKSLTQQHFKSETDVNTIMKRYRRLDVVSQFHPNQAVFGAFDQVPDGMFGAMLRVRQAEEAFMELPAHVRKEFDNEPAALVHALEAAQKGDPSAKELLRSVGLLKTKAEPPAEPVAAATRPGAEGEPGSAPKEPETPA